jgi:hypothetical protein
VGIIVRFRDGHQPSGQQKLEPIVEWLIEYWLAILL